MTNLTNDIKKFINQFIFLLVDEPDEIKMNILESETNIIIELLAPKYDAGKLIGRNGLVAKSIRALIIAIGARHRRIIRLTIITKEN